MDILFSNKKRIYPFSEIFILTFFLFIHLSVVAQTEPDADRPNIIIILADDMGYSDMGSFGSEINTPNLDALAEEGVRFTQFYTHASCSPSRSIMLTGVDNHQNGLGNMSEWTAPNQKNVPGYEGILNDRFPTLPQLLLDAGYHTYMAGKWHMGKAPEKLPRARGFERDFSLLDGAGSYWDMTNMTSNTPMSLFSEDGLYLSELPKNYYATKTYTDKIIQYIENDHDDGKPFFAFVSHQAPHDPYHLPRKSRNHHIGEYDVGWDALRQQRLERQIEMGIVPENTQLAERMWIVPPHSQLAPASRAFLGKKMELYAEMVENLDYHVGRLVEYLKEIGEYENTVFIVFGDNGAEGNDLFESIAGTPGTLNYLYAAMKWSQTDINAWGNPGSFVGYGPAWAQVSMTPFSQYKGLLAEGGIRNALIVSGPSVERESGSIHNAIMHIADIVPTLLDIAEWDYPASQNGKQLPSLVGKSWLPMLSGEKETIRSEEEYLAWELFGNQALRQGEWKIRWQYLPYGKEVWELYNLESDPGERHDIAKEHPEKVKQLLLMWNEYVHKNNVILPSRSVFEAHESAMPERFPDDPGYPPLINNRQYIPPADMIKGSDQ